MFRIAVRSTRSARNLRAVPVRFSSEGSVARSKEFSKKEKAHEDQYAKQHEQEQLKKLKEQIEKKRQELESLEKEHAEVANNQK